MSFTENQLVLNHLKRYKPISTMSGEGKLVLDETMVMVIEEGFEDDSKYGSHLNPNGQLVLTRANRIISELEHEHEKDIDFKFVDYEMHSYSKVDDYNYVAKMTLKGRNSKGEYTYMETEAYIWARIRRQQC